MKSTCRIISAAFPCDLCFETTRRDTIANRGPSRCVQQTGSVACLPAPPSFSPGHRPPQPRSFQRVDRRQGCAMPGLAPGPNGRKAALGAYVLVPRYTATATPSHGPIGRECFDLALWALLAAVSCFSSSWGRRSA